MLRESPARPHPVRVCHLALRTRHSEVDVPRVGAVVVLGLVEEGGLDGWVVEVRHVGGRPQLGDVRRLELHLLEFAEVDLLEEGVALDVEGGVGEAADPRQRVPRQQPFDQIADRRRQPRRQVEASTRETRDLAHLEALPAVEGGPGLL